MCIRDSATGPAGRILVAGVVEPRYLVPDPFVAAFSGTGETCLLYTSDAADERSSVDLGGRRIIKKKNKRENISRKGKYNNQTES